MLSTMTTANAEEANTVAYTERDSENQDCTVTGFIYIMHETKNTCINYQFQQLWIDEKEQGDLFEGKLCIAE